MVKVLTMPLSKTAKLRLWVRFGLYRHRTGTSVPGGKADLNGAKAGVADRMSDVGARADLDRNVRNFAS